MGVDIEVLRFPGVTERSRDRTREPAGQFVIESAWGVTIDPVAQHPEFAAGAPIEGILDLSGEWWCVATSADGRRLIFSDRFGMQPLALATATTQDGASLFVGTSAAATAHAIRAAGGRLSTDWSYVLETLSAKHDFLDCLFDFSTPTDGVRWLPPDKAIEIDDDGYRVVPRPEVLRSGSYEALLHNGIERAVADVQRLVDTHERIAINLSGGKDSRVVLAVVLASGCADRIQVSATDPAPPGGSTAHAPTVQKDLEISSRLVQGLGLGWMDWRSPRDMWPTTLEGELARFQQYRHGLTNQFVPVGFAHRLTEAEARINGAGGEIFRENWSGVLTKHPSWPTLGHRVETADADARALMRALRSPLHIPDELAERGEANFADAIAHLPGRTIAESLDRHYEVFRMRGHAGGRRWGQSFGVTNFSLLQQSALARASEQLDPSERYSGKMLFDIIEVLAPELHDLEYESGPWPWSGRRPEVRDWTAVKASVASYRDAQERSRQAIRPNRYKGRGRPDMAPAIDTGLRAMAAQMAEDGIDPLVIEPVRAAPPKDLRGQGRMLARLFNWASAFGDDRLCPRAMPQAPPMVRSYVRQA